VGRDAVVAPFHRVYGDRRLPQLLSQFFVERELFWAKNPDNMWVGCDRQEALAFPASTHPKDPSQCVYALGCFVLTKT